MSVLTMSAGAYAGPTGGRRRRGTCPSVPFARTQSAPFQAGLPAQGSAPPAFPTGPLQARQWRVGGTPARPFQVRPPITAARPRGNFRVRPDKSLAPSTPLPFSRGPNGFSVRTTHPWVHPRLSAEGPSKLPPTPGRRNTPVTGFKQGFSVDNRPISLFPGPETGPPNPPTRRTRPPNPRSPEQLRGPDLNPPPGKVNLPARYSPRV